MSGIIYAFITQTPDIFNLSYDKKAYPYLNNNKVPNVAILISSRSHQLVFPPETQQQYNLTIPFLLKSVPLHLNYGSNDSTK